MRFFDGFRSRRTLWVVLPVSAGLLLYGLVESWAQTSAARSTEVRGTVRRMTTTPRGETDGAVLDNGASLHWPPHLQDRFSTAIKVGDQVRATGRSETGLAGDSHFEVEKVTNLSTNATVENPDYAQGPPRPGHGPGIRRPAPTMAEVGGGPARDLRSLPAAVEVSGTVLRITTAPRGEVDGAVLDNGTWLHWPPHMQDRFASVVKQGDRVRATGRTERGPAGDTHFEVQNVTNLQTNATADNPDLANGPPVGTGGAQSAPAQGATDIERRLQNLQDQIDVLRKDVERLRQ